MVTHGIDDYARSLARTCESCRRAYTIGEFLESNEDYFPRPYDYRAGCERYCLSCWLGVGPNDFPEDQDNAESSLPGEDECAALPVDGEVPEGADWPYEAVYPDLVGGRLMSAYSWFFDRGAGLAILPISRTHVNRPTFFPGGIAFYPAGCLDLDSLGLVPNRDRFVSQDDPSSLSSGVSVDVLSKHPLIVLPCKLEWEVFRNATHRSHLELIRWLSEEIDRRCLDFIRYQLCRIEPIEALPGRAGQLDSNPIMAGALLYDPAVRDARIVGGAAFTHVLTRGLGLGLRQLDWDSFPAEGEVGHIVQHALSLYAALLEASNPTARFMQALSLLEFLAYPDEYKTFVEVKKVIARYVARDRTEYQLLLDRFLELTGKKDPASGRIIGYRTRVVHMGERIERIVPGSDRRKQLFLELDRYIRPVIDHMIQYSSLTLADYQPIREDLKPYEN